MKLKLGVMSDTHWNSYDAVDDGIFRVFADVDMILHTGDFASVDILEYLETFKPVIAVCGNCDDSMLRRMLPDRREMEIGGIRFGMLHGSRKDGNYYRGFPEMFPSCRIIVCGHTHIPLCERLGDVLIFNPGSTTFPRSEMGPTVGIFEIEEGRIRAAHVQI